MLDGGVSRQISVRIRHHLTPLLFLVHRRVTILDRACVLAYIGVTEVAYICPILGLLLAIYSVDRVSRLKVCKTSTSIKVVRLHSRRNSSMVLDLY